MENNRFCPSCGAANSSEAAFCGKCGKSLPAMSQAPSAPTPPSSSYSSTPPVTSHESHTARNVGIIILAIIVVAIIALLAFNGGFGSGVQNVLNQRPTSVLVSGAASTTGFSTHPVNIGFTSDTGQLYNTAVVNGQYNVSLLNDHSYSVQISWAGGLGSSGTCSAGSFSISQGPGSGGLTENWSC